MLSATPTTDNLTCLEEAVYACIQEKETIMNRHVRRKAKNTGKLK